MLFVSVTAPLLHALELNSFFEARQRAFPWHGMNCRPGEFLPGMEAVGWLGYSRRAVANDRPVLPQEIVKTTAYLSNLLRHGEFQLRKVYLRMFIDTVEVTDGEIIITGSKRVAARAVEETAKKPSNTVPVYMQDWRPRRDLNARPPD